MNKIIVKHHLKSGAVLNDIEGYLVPLNNDTAGAYNIIKNDEASVQAPDVEGVNNG